AAVWPVGSCTSQAVSSKTGAGIALNCSAVFMVGALKVAAQHPAPSDLWSWTVTGAVSGELGSGSDAPRPLTVIFPMPAAPALSWIVASPAGVSSRSAYRKPVLVSFQHGVLAHTPPAGAVADNRRVPP